MNAEPGKRAAKLRGKPIPKPRRGREKDDFDWRADPVSPRQTTSLLSGYKSVKHRWACKYREQQEREMLTAANGRPDWHPNGEPLGFASMPDLLAAHNAGPIAKAERGSRDMAVDSPEISEVEAEHGGGEEAKAGDTVSPGRRGKDSSIPRWHRSGSLNKAKRPAGTKDKEEEIKAGVKQQRKKAQEEVARDHEEKAKQATTASLANESLQEHVRRAEDQAEAELAQAAEHDRGAQAASSLHRELRDREGPDPVQELDSQDHKQGWERRKLAIDRPGSGNRSRQQNTKGQAKTSRQHSLDRKRAAAHGLGHSDLHGAEDTAETNGGPSKKRRAPDSFSPIASSRGGAQSAENAVNGVSTAEHAGMLTQVTLVEGNEKEHLGELDLQQLDSFKDLWRTMRAAYARLPKGDLRLVYKDLDNDLMQLQDEQWPYFKSVVRGLFLMEPKGSL